MKHRCDNCGKAVDQRDFGNGATYEVISHGVGGDVFEIICKNCNDKLAQDDAA